MLIANIRKQEELRRIVYKMQREHLQRIEIQRQQAAMFHSNRNQGKSLEYDELDRLEAENMLKNLETEDKRLRQEIKQEHQNNNRQEGENTTNSSNDTVPYK